MTDSSTDQIVRSSYVTEDSWTDLDTRMIHSHAIVVVVASENVSADIKSDLGMLREPMHLLHVYKYEDDDLMQVRLF